MEEISHNTDWKLELFCKTKSRRDTIVNFILQEKCIKFIVELVLLEHSEGYRIYVCGVWYDNLKRLTKKLKKLEDNENSERTNTLDWTERSIPYQKDRKE